MEDAMLSHSFFNPARGGHAPGDIRDAFEEAIEAFQQWDGGEPEPLVDVRDQDVPISRICGLLWNCTDIMPSVACGAFGYFDDDLPQGSTYAQGARRLKALVCADQVLAA